MRVALALARRGLGRVAPNPAVGCVLVRDGCVLGRGWTQPGGRPHAETDALARAGEAARGATVYVTLEPCSHHGRTPPCAGALIDAGIARCVVALDDPDPRVAGQGLDRLRDAGIAVTSGVLAGEAAAVNAGYLLHRREHRPMVTLKLATTLDGRIATRTGESRWITGADSRTRVHLMRADHDAVMVGSGTAVTDDPRLDVRLPGLEDRRPLRVVLDGRLRLPLTHRLVAGAREHPTLLVTRADVPKDRRRAYADCGVEVVAVDPDAAGGLCPVAVLGELAARGVTRVLAEGGGMLAAALLRADLVDRLVWFRAGKVIGGDGIPALAGFGLEALARAPAFVPEDFMALGADVMESYRRADKG